MKKMHIVVTILSMTGIIGSRAPCPDSDQDLQKLQTLREINIPADRLRVSSPIIFPLSCNLIVNLCRQLDNGFLTLLGPLKIVSDASRTSSAMISRILCGNARVLNTRVKSLDGSQTILPMDSKSGSGLFCILNAGWFVR